MLQSEGIESSHRICIQISRFHSTTKHAVNITLCQQSLGSEIFTMVFSFFLSSYFSSIVIVFCDLCPQISSNTKINLSTSNDKGSVCIVVLRNFHIFGFLCYRRIESNRNRTAWRDNTHLIFPKSISHSSKFFSHSY